MNLKIFFKIVISFGIFVASLQITFANDIYEFQNFLDDIKIVENLKLKTNFLSYFDRIEQMENWKCIVQNYENYSYISPVCFVKDIQYLSVDKSLDYLVQNLNMFYDMYQQDSYNFVYKPTKPSFSYSIFDEYLKYRWSIYEKIALLYLAENGKMVKIDNYVLARLMFEDYSFYVVPTNLANRWPCSLTNYKLAIWKLNWKELKPWEVLDLNALISNDPRSCRWQSTKYFLFYGWSCGASSQLFRLSLIMPDLTVLDRAGHEKWRSLYYWANIMWDDAAMYENSKKFVIRNDFDNSVFFKTYEKWNYIYLVWIVPTQINNYVWIIKNVNWYRSSLFKQIYDNYWLLIWSYQFDSVYSTIYGGKA